jgi:hypothetical protein
MHTMAGVEQDDSAMSSLLYALWIDVFWHPLDVRVTRYSEGGDSVLLCSSNNTAIFHMVQTSNIISIINTKPHAQPKEKNNGQYLVVKFVQFVTPKYEDLSYAEL